MYQQRSTMDEFPMNYKFIGAGVFASASASLTQRGNEDIIAVLGDVGGMTAFLTMALGALVTKFADLRSMSLMGLWLFKEATPTIYTKNQVKTQIGVDCEMSVPDNLEIR